MQIVWWSTFVMTWKEIPRPAPKASLWLQAFNFLAPLLQINYATIAEEFWSGFLAGSFVGNRRVSGSSFCFFVEVCVFSTGNNSLFSSVISRMTHGSVHLTCGRK